MLRNLNDESVEQLKGTGGFNFSATKLENLLASEYTLVDIVVDVSGSVQSFKDDLEKCVQKIIEACRKSPRADNLMVRLTEFNPRVDEVHGYKLLTNCNVDDYKGIFNPSGGTALFDATHKALEACIAYGKSLVDNSYTVNAIVFVLTDGDDNSSTRTSKMVKDIIAKTRKSESLESIVTVLVGINTNDSSIAQYLMDFNTEAGFSAYVEVQNATAQKLAKLADFVSKSISSSSASLGSGVSDYPYLAPKYKAIEAYRSRIQDIRNATYKNKNQDMIISGSLDNMQQSTNLSKYISEIAIKEAQYTEALEKSKIYKETFLTKFFADGLFISDKIYELPVK